MIESSVVIPTPKPKAIGALLPYAISLDQPEGQEIIDAIFYLSKISSGWSFRQGCIERYTTTLLSEPVPPSLNRVIVHLSTYAQLDRWDENMITRWTAVVSAVPYSEKVGWSVVSTLLELANTETLRPLVSIDVWALLKKQSSLPPVCEGRDLGNDRAVVHHVRGLGDLDILKSYFLLIWSEWNELDNSGFAEMQVSIAEDFGGIGMVYHRVDLIERLDHVLGELGRGLEHLAQYRLGLEEHDVRKRERQYRTLREGLFEAEQKAMKNFIGMSQVNPF